MRNHLRLTCCAAALLLPLASAQSSSGEEAPDLPVVHTSIYVAASIEPSADQVNQQVFKDTLFSRDDQIFHQLNGGLNLVQHEGGGKSVEVRRFGFNLDHGGVNGGLKVMVDDVQQNQTTQGHGQGYLGSLKTLTPELIESVQLINGPFSAEYGDFSGLGVVHIRQRESLDSPGLVRIQTGSFGNRRFFGAWSPKWRKTTALFSYETSRNDGPFTKSLDYVRDNITGNVTRRLSGARAIGMRWNLSRNSYNSSGQIPLAAVQSGQLDRFGFLDPGEGGHTHSGTISLYLRQDNPDGSSFKVDGFASRSLFDLYSNFTYFLNDPLNGDAIQQHDSRLQEGANFQYLKPHHLRGGDALFTSGGSLHGNQIQVGLYSRVNRDPTGIITKADAGVANGAGYFQETLSLLQGRLTVGAGLRYDLFRFGVRTIAGQLLDDGRPSRVSEIEGRFQPKVTLAYRPFRYAPFTLHANYGRGIASTDARSIVQAPGNQKLATTDFYQFGAAGNIARLSLSADLFAIDRSNELVYVADDGSVQLQGPSRAYGWEGKTSIQLNRYLSFDGGVTKIANAFYRGTLPRSYVVRAPKLTANAALTLSGWRGWSGSLRMRAISQYRLDNEDPSIVANGNTIFDLSLVRKITSRMDANFSMDNALGRSYYEAQNYLESRPFRNGPSGFGIHGTPGYPRTFTIGVTYRFGD